MAEHVESCDLVLFLIKVGLSQEEHDMIEHHLKDCSSCQTLLEEIKKKFLQERNQTKFGCDFIQNNLIDYIEQKTPASRRQQITEHLESCPECYRMHYLLANIPAMDEVDLTRYPVPDELFSQIIKKNRQQFRQKSLLLTALRLKNKLQDILDVVAYTRKVIELTLQPLPARTISTPPLFGTDNSILIAHEGGEIKFNVHQPGRRVVLLSLKDEVLSEKISDNSGFVKFQKFEKAIYRVRVEYCHIVKVDK
ncbi:zf-HC2 domain-containing protein [candidate division KSB1 bacterium]|nr:zf-HC2 domain-containing protein [candidate division KSB1 bacterium]